MSQKEEKKRGAEKVKELKAKEKALTKGVKDKMSLNPARSVGVKLFLAFFSAIFIIVLAVGLFSYAQSKKIIQDKVDQANRQTITQVADKLELGLGMYESESMKIIADTDMASLLSQWKSAGEKGDNDSAYTQLTTVQAIGKKLSSIVLANNTISSIHILPMSDLLPISTGSFGGAAGKGDYQSEDWFKRTLDAGGRVVWLDAKEKGYSNMSPNPAVGMARQLTITSTGDREQVLIFEIPVSALGSYLSNINFGESSHTLIVSDSGNVVYSADPAQIGKAAAVKLDANLLEGSTEAAGSKTMTVDGKQQLVVFKKMADNGWSIISTVPVSEMLKDTKAIRNIMWLSVLAAVLVAIGVGFLVANMIGKPLRVMRTLMHQAEQGDLTVAVKGRPRADEIGQLGKSFNQMMGQITSLVDQTNKSASQVLSTAGELLNAAKQTTTSAKEIAVATEEIANGASSLAVEAERGNNLTHDIGDKMKQAVTTNRR
ncbi:cache domain-containing protein, partial [Gorillibacterium sp. sgz500922]|uniref:cache domain-containing protein n=1 Tax=Gorillibacterium sp. sgz500922 TaxID=3446694 RepID=UPI003F676135